MLLANMLIGRAGARRVSRAWYECQSNRAGMLCLELVLTDLQHNLAVILAFLH